MPTLCKIMLDATDYRKELQTVLAESRAASAALGKSYASASASAQDLADSIGRIPEAKTVAVTADVSQAEAALSDLSDSSDLSDKTFTIRAEVEAPEIPTAKDQTYAVTGSVNAPEIPQVEDQDYTITGSVNAPEIPQVEDQSYAVTGTVNAPEIPQVEDQQFSVSADVSQAEAALSDLSDMSDKTFTIRAEVEVPEIPQAADQDYTITGRVDAPAVPEVEDQTYAVTGTVNAPDVPQVEDQQFSVSADVSQAEAALSDLSDSSDLSDKTVAVSADVSQAEEALYSIPDHKDVTITIPDVKPVSISVIADTVKIAELKAQIAELEDKEITAQVKVVDDQIALLQQELDAIRNKDITVTTQADLEQAEKLKAVIAALQDKKIQIQTEVHSEQLDDLRNQLQKTQSGAGRFSMRFRNLIPQGFGAQIKTGAAAVSAFGAAAGASVPPVGLLSAAVNALLSPVSLVMAALSGLAAVGMAVWDKLTISAEEYAEKTKAASEEAQRQAEKVKAQDQAAQGYITRLQEIAAAETTGNAAKTETLQLLSNLESQYGNLGAVIDETTGKIVNMAEVEERANAARNQKLANARYKQSNAQMDEAKAAYMKVKGSEWFTTEAGAGKYFDEMRKNMSPEQILKIMEAQAAKASTQDEITGYNEVVNKLRTSIETRNKARQINATGYETKEEYLSAMANKSRQVGQSQAANIQLDRVASRRQADNALTFIRDSDARISNRQALIDEEKKRQTGIQKEIDQAKKDVDTADTAEKKLDAQKRLLDAQAQYKRSQASIAELEQQIAQIKYNQSEAKRKLNDQSKFELEYNRLIASGEYDKAAALKLEYNLKQQNLKLTEEETKKLLEQQKITTGQKLKKSLEDQAFSLYGQAMENAGRGKEFAEERALKEARETKGRDLTSSEIAAVRKLAKISYDMANRKESKYNMEIKTNDLTARGGFQTGAFTPNTDQTAHSQLKEVQEIRTELRNLTNQFKEYLK